MIKKQKILYISRIVSFIIQFYLIFMITDVIIHTGLLGYLFITLYIIYNVSIMYELLSKNDKTKNDFIYNIMQLGYFSYIGVIFYRVRFSSVFVGIGTQGYFNLNFGILCLLMIFILLYRYLELKKEK